MARHTILNKHGKPTEFFWNDKHATDPQHVVVFRKTETGIKKMRGVTFDSKSGRINKQ
jgi:hypothetical protein